jgi:hypothetical protein
MPSESRTARPERPGAAEIEPSADLSRRSVLRRAAGAGVATLAASTLLGSAGQALAATARPAGRAAADHDESDGADAKNVVVHIRDARSGEMDIFSGTSKTRLRDKALAARLVRAID